LQNRPFGDSPVAEDRGRISQAILAIGRQDTDPQGHTAPHGLEILAASSDHLVVASLELDLAIGAEITYQLNYSALVRAMTSPFVSKTMKAQSAPSPKFHLVSDAVHLVPASFAF